MSEGMSSERLLVARLHLPLTNPDPAKQAIDYGHAPCILFIGQRGLDAATQGPAHPRSLAGGADDRSIDFITRELGGFATVQRLSLSCRRHSLSRTGNGHGAGRPWLARPPDDGLAVHGGRRIRRENGALLLPRHNLGRRGRQSRPPSLSTRRDIGGQRRFRDHGVPSHHRSPSSMARDRAFRGHGYALGVPDDAKAVVHVRYRGPRKRTQWPIPGSYEPAGRRRLRLHTGGSDHLHCGHGRPVRGDGCSKRGLCAGAVRYKKRGSGGARSPWIGPSELLRIFSAAQRESHPDDSHAARVNNRGLRIYAPERPARVRQGRPRHRRPGIRLLDCLSTGRRGDRAPDPGEHGGLQTQRHAHVRHGTGLWPWPDGHLLGVLAVGLPDHLDLHQRLRIGGRHLVQDADAVQRLQRAARKGHGLVGA